MKTAYLKSGKVGNAVYSRNRHGPICFARFTPANPRTAKQMAVRKLWGVIAALWRLLSDEQREQWRAAGRQQRCRRRMGPGAPLTGFHYFMRVNMRRAYRGEAWMETPGELRGVERGSVGVWSRGNGNGERESGPRLSGSIQRPTYGVATVLLRCSNGILGGSLRCLGRPAMLFAAVGGGRGTGMDPIQAAMN